MAALSLGGGPPVPVTRSRNLVLWAWERPEDLTFLRPGQADVAYLARTVQLMSGNLTVRPRLQPMRPPAGARLTAVIRLETGGRAWEAGRDAERAAATAVTGALRNGVEELQIDFDALESERAFYRQLVLDVRHSMPADVRLSITALASWCLGDRWLEGLPVDDAVPMLFRMGPDRAAVVARLNAGGDFDAPVCRHSVGVATDEPGIRIPPGRRVYVFHAAPWTAGALTRFLGAPR